MKTTSKTSRSSASEPALSSSGGKRGNMKPAEIKPLVIAARKAFDRQSEAGLVDDGETFDSWRHRQCMEAVGKPGITACNHGDFQPLLAHFQTLAGDDSAAFRSLMKTGKPTDHAAPGDSFEVRRQIAKSIADHLLFHIHIATSSIDQLIAEGAEEWYRANPEIPFPGPNPDWLSKIRSKKTSIDANGKGPINVGYLVWITRQKTRRPDLQLGKDWQAGLAERCTAKQLDEIRSTIINRIAAVEGIGDRHNRNKSQRQSKSACASSDPF